MIPLKRAELLVCAIGNECSLFSGGREKRDKLPDALREAEAAASGSSRKRMFVYGSNGKLKCVRLKAEQVVADDSSSIQRRDGRRDEPG
jgi:hypothetical protein